MKGKRINKDREFAVILERIHTDIKVIIEDLTAVKNKIDAVFEEQGRIREEIFIIKTDIRVIKDDIVKIKDRLDRVENRLGRIEEDITGIKTDFGKRLTLLEASHK